MARSIGSHRRSRSRSRRRSARTSRSPSTSRSSRARPRAVVADATERTHRWAERSLAAHTRDGPGDLRDRPGRARAGPAGRLDPGHRVDAVRRDLHRRAGRRRDARAARCRARRRDPAARRRPAAALPDGARFAGGPARGRPSRGVDLFDSVLPARVARNGQFWVPGGRLNIRNQRFLDDPAPIQDDCPCLACRRFSRAYLAHLFRAQASCLAYRLATCHNLTFTLDFMVRIRAAIGAGTFPASMSELRLRAGRVSGGEVAEKSA